MFELCSKIEFAAGHHLKGYPGNCARPHGHNWVIVAYVQSNALDSVGIALDFREFKSVLKEITDPWDHRDLNELADFSECNPSAEWMAKITFDRLAARLNRKDLRVDRVTVCENDRNSATYWQETL